MLLWFSHLATKCPEGATGEQCNKCTEGYFGNPKKNMPCQMCNCSGNINLNDPGNCHNESGKCLKCINNTTGDHCHKCLDGYYGDAVHGTCICECYNT